MGTPKDTEKGGAAFLPMPEGRGLRRRDPMTTTPGQWFSASVPVWLTLATLLTVALLARQQQQQLAAALLRRWAQRHGVPALPPALVYLPPILTPGALAGGSLALALLTTLALGLSGALWLALLLAPVALALGVWLLCLWAEQRYRAALDAALPAAVARLAAQVRQGSGVQSALATILADLAPGPLASEWQWLLRQLGQPLPDGRLTTLRDTVVALSQATPSRRHRTWLQHLAGCVDQAHDVIRARLEAAAQALYAADRRRSAAVTELAQMRYSGMVVSLAGGGLGLYLLLTQWERARVVYQGWLGLAAGLIVGGALVAPLIGGFLLARVDDLDY